MCGSNRWLTPPHGNGTGHHTSCVSDPGNITNIAAPVPRGDHWIFMSEPGNSTIFSAIKSDMAGGMGNHRFEPHIVRRLMSIKTIPFDSSVKFATWSIPYVKKYEDSENRCCHFSKWSLRADFCKENGWIFSKSIISTPRLHFDEWQHPFSESSHFFSSEIPQVANFTDYRNYNRQPTMTWNIFLTAEMFFNFRRIFRPKYAFFWCILAKNRLVSEPFLYRMAKTAPP